VCDIARSQYCMEDLAYAEALNSMYDQPSAPPIAASAQPQMIAASAHAASAQLQPQPIAASAQPQPIAVSAQPQPVDASAQPQPIAASAQPGCPFDLGARVDDEIFGLGVIKELPTLSMHPGQVLISFDCEQTADMWRTWGHVKALDHPPTMVSNELAQSKRPLSVVDLTGIDSREVRPRPSALPAPGGTGIARYFSSRPPITSASTGSASPAAQPAALSLAASQQAAGSAPRQEELRLTSQPSQARTRASSEALGSADGEGEEGEVEEEEEEDEGLPRLPALSCRASCSKRVLHQCEAGGRQAAKSRALSRSPSVSHSSQTRAWLNPTDSCTAKRARRPA